MTIRIHIQRVILDGFTAHDSTLLRQSLESALAQSISEKGLPQELMGGAAHASLQGGTVHLDAMGDRQTICTGIALGVWQAFGHAQRGRPGALSEKASPERTTSGSGENRK